MFDIITSFVLRIIGRLDKIIDSIQKYKKEERKRKDLELIRRKKEIAHIAKTFNFPYLAKYYDKEAAIIEDTKEE